MVTHVLIHIYWMVGLSCRHVARKFAILSRSSRHLSLSLYFIGNLLTIHAPPNWSYYTSSSSKGGKREDFGLRSFFTGGLWSKRVEDPWPPLLHKWPFDQWLSTFFPQSRGIFSVMSITHMQLYYKLMSIEYINVIFIICQIFITVLETC